MLTFADWEHYTDDAGHARTLDWSPEAMRGAAPYPYLEALRQALAMRGVTGYPDMGGQFLELEAFEQGTVVTPRRMKRFLQRLRAIMCYGITEIRGAEGGTAALWGSAQAPVEWQWVDGTVPWQEGDILGASELPKRLWGYSAAGYVGNTIEAEDVAILRDSPSYTVMGIQSSHLRVYRKMIEPCRRLCVQNGWRAAVWETKTSSVKYAYSNVSLADAIAQFNSATAVPFDLPAVYTLSSYAIYRGYQSYTWEIGRENITAQAAYPLPSPVYPLQQGIAHPAAVTQTMLMTMNIAYGEYYNPDFPRAELDLPHYLVAEVMPTATTHNWTMKVGWRGDMDAPFTGATELPGTDTRALGWQATATSPLYLDYAFPL